jgi:hypothetical protein
MVVKSCPINFELNVASKTWVNPQAMNFVSPYGAAQRYYGREIELVQVGSMPFCVELDNLKDTDAPIHQPAAMLVAAD